MFDMSNLPIPGGIVVAGLLWTGVSIFALGPVIADRTITNSGWATDCEKKLNRNLKAQIPGRRISPKISCNQILGDLNPQMKALCQQGGNALFDLMTADPLSEQEERRRRRQIDRLNRLAQLSTSRCSCAAHLVANDRLNWGLYAGSARLLGRFDDLQSDLNQALHSPYCEFGKRV